MVDVVIWDASPVPIQAAIGLAATVTWDTSPIGAAVFDNSLLASIAMPELPPNGDLSGLVDENAAFLVDENGKNLVW